MQQRSTSENEKKTPFHRRFERRVDDVERQARRKLRLELRGVVRLASSNVVAQITKS